MDNLEEKLKDLLERNNELVQSVQYWKMTAAQRELRELDLMKEINELRLQLSRLRNGGALQAKKLEAALQTSSKEVLSHMVQASEAVTRTIELAKSYMREQQELDSALPRWSTISGTPAKERVHRVPPLMVGGHSIQPVVSLSRTMLNTNLSRSMTSTNQSHNTSNRAVQLHMLQDVYIPLTRIDTADDSLVNDPESDPEDDIEENIEESELQDNARINEESPNVTDAFETSRRLDAVAEDIEPEEEEESTPARVSTRTDNALEGPSWLLDIPSRQTTRPRNKVNLEPDSTTELYNSQDSPMMDVSQCANETVGVPASEFSPTVRRRKRTSSPPSAQLFSPHFSPRPLQRKTGHSGRILKVLVAKMRLSGDDETDVTPPKRASMAESPRREHAFMTFDAPSPNGATDAGVIVMDSKTIVDHCASGEPAVSIANNVNLNRRGRGSRDTSQASHDSRQDGADSSETRHIHNESQDGRASRQSGRESRQSGRESRIEHDRSGALHKRNETHHDGCESRQDSHDSSQEGRDSRTAQDARQIRNDCGQDGRDIRQHANGSRQDGRDSRQGRESDSSSCSEPMTEGRTRRPRKNVIYKEKPLNRKMRR